MYSRKINIGVHILKNMRKYSTSNLVNVSVNDKSGIATVTMQRQPVNGLNLELITELNNALVDLEKNKSRGMILTSASKTVFSAGLDIMEMYKPDKERVRNFWTSLQQLWMTLYGSPYPTAAAINGHSPAGGCLLAASCEYRVMLPNYSIGLNETKLGIIAPPWFAATMRNTIGFRKTEMALTLGHLFNTDEALHVGLIDEIAPTKESAIAKCENYLDKFAKIAPKARAASKLVMRQKYIQDLMENREHDLERFLQTVEHPSTQKNLETYLEALKRKKA